MNDAESTAEYARAIDLAELFAKVAPGMANVRMDIALWIKAYSAEFIDALVVAGVLHRHDPGLNQLYPYYTVVQPHKHEWRVENLGYSRLCDIHLVCNGACGERRVVPNRLPIEVPND